MKELWNEIAILSLQVSKNTDFVIKALPGKLTSESFVYTAIESDLYLGSGRIFNLPHLISCLHGPRQIA